MRRGTPVRVLVAGGGFAGVETLLALRSLAEERVRLELLCDRPQLVYRPAATAEAFGMGVVRRFPLEAIAAEAGATLRRGAVDAVASGAHRVRLASGAHLDYDVLVLALGARAQDGVPGAVTFRDERDAQRIAGILSALRSGQAGSVAFAAPSGTTWTLPLYELALLAAARAGTARISLVTPEPKPLAVFGAAGGRLSDLLADRGIRVFPGVVPEAFGGGGLRVGYEGLLRVDRAVAIPRLVGPRVSGVPRDWSRFVSTDRLGRVEGQPDVFAVGDMTSFPVKQGGLATQQADAVARTVAAAAGAPVDVTPQRPVLRGRLIGADTPVYLQALLDDDGHPSESTYMGDGATPPWWPAAKVFGRHLAPFLAGQPAGVPQSAP